MGGGISAIKGGFVLDADRVLLFAEHQAVDQFDALHEGMIGIGDFVFPHSESAAGIDIVLFEVGNDLAEDLVTLD